MPPVADRSGSDRSTVCIGATLDVACAESVPMKLIVTGQPRRHNGCGHAQNRDAGDRREVPYPHHVIPRLPLLEMDK